jgi:tRNA pseudouridine55 synthase
MNGLLVIDKHSGMTSRDVVNRVQRWFPRKTKIGHTGTLDPLATGVLVVCVGAATRLADYVQAMGKSYASRFRLGVTSTTDDADGDVTETPVATPPTREQIDASLAKFVGTIEQVPPAVSALKVEGRRAHDLVRKGEEVQLAARTVRIDAIRVTGYEWPWLDVEVDCGKGTYIRSIARDLGAALGCGGLVQSLRRTRVGPFTAEQGIGVDVSPEEGRAAVVPSRAAFATWPRVVLTGVAADRFRSGQVVEYSGEAELGPGYVVPVLDTAGEMIGIGETFRGRRVAPEIVLAR